MLEDTRNVAMTSEICTGGLAVDYAVRIVAVTNAGDLSGEPTGSSCAKLLAGSEPCRVGETDNETPVYFIYSFIVMTVQGTARRVRQKEIISLLTRPRPHWVQQQWVQNTCI